MDFKCSIYLNVWKTNIFNNYILHIMNNLNLNLEKYYRL